MKLLILWVLFLGLPTYAATPDFPKEDQRSKLFLATVATMKRLDGEALYVRQNRHRSWDEITDQLHVEAVNANDWYQLARVLVQFDFAYPNLHSRARPGQFAMSHFPKPAVPRVDLQAE